MNEAGKIHLQRNLCRYAFQLPLIDQEKYEGFDICCYQWAQNISKIGCQDGRDIPALAAKGFASLSVLSEFLSKKRKTNGILKAIILSDGYFKRDDFKMFEKWKNDQKNIFIITVAVGVDANLYKLERISTNNRVYLAENISTAIDSALFDHNEKLVAPISTAQILQYKSAESTEKEEYWDN